MESPADVIIRLSFDLSRVIRHMMLSVTDDGVHVNFLQIHALALVDEHPGMTMKELADALRVASPSATSFVNRLVRMRLIARERDLRNRKLVRLSLMPEGKAALREKRTRRTALLKRHLNLLTIGEQKQLAHILKKLHNSSGISPSSSLP